MGQAIKVMSKGGTHRLLFKEVSTKNPFRTLVTGKLLDLLISQNNNINRKDGQREIQLHVLASLVT